MGFQPPLKHGIIAGSVKDVPTDWSPTWFRRFISNFLAGADVRNAIGSGGITITGTLTTPYATIGVTGPLVVTGQTVTTASPPAGAAGALPATPAGYLTVVINGVSRRIPFY